MANGDPTAPGGTPTREQQAKGAKAKRQRRLLYAAGAAVVLALIFLMQRGGGGAPAADEEAAAPGEAPSTAAPPFGSTFADNGEAAGNLGTSITEGLAEVGAGLEGVNAALSDLSDAQTDQPPVQPVAGAGPTNITINTGAGRARQRDRNARSAPGRTSSHAAAGLRRVAKNTYVDKSGRKFHRVGKGEKSHFEKGPGGKKSGGGKKATGRSGGTAAPARAAAARRPTTPPAGPRPHTAPPGVHGRRPAARKRR